MTRTDESIENQQVPVAAVLSIVETPCSWQGRAAPQRGAPAQRLGRCHCLASGTLGSSGSLFLK